MPKETLIERLDDLFPQHELWVHCEVCRHSLKLNRTKLREIHGNLRLEALGWRSRCPDCGAKGVKVLIVWDC